MFQVATRLSFPVVKRLLFTNLTHNALRLTGSVQWQLARYFECELDVNKS